MRKQKDEPIDMLQGTLDMLILRTLLFGPRHGHAIAKSIEQTSQDVLRVDHGSLYPALQRLERRGLISAKWGTSENNRRARFYRLTAAGRKMLQNRAQDARIRRRIGPIMTINGEDFHRTIPLVLCRKRPALDDNAVPCMAQPRRAQY